MTFSFRRAVDRDAGELRALAAAAYSHYIPRIDRPPVPMTADYDRAVREDEVWVASEGGSIGAMIVLVRHPDHLLIENLAVDPAVQGRGLGGRLLSLAEQRAREYGVPELRLYTNEAMTENIAYYPRRGFTETHRDEQHGFRRVFFSKAAGDTVPEVEPLSLCLTAALDGAAQGQPGQREQEGQAEREQADDLCGHHRHAEREQRQLRRRVGVRLLPAVRAGERARRCRGADPGEQVCRVADPEHRAAHPVQVGDLGKVERGGADRAQRGRAVDVPGRRGG